MIKTFKLNKEEIEVLKTIDKVNKAGDKNDFHSIVKAYGAKNSGKMIPVMGRLEDEGYVFSKGAIYRHFSLTEKGLAEIK